MNDIQSLQEQVESLKLQRQSQILQSRIRYHEHATSLVEAWGDYVNPRDPLLSEREYFGELPASHISRAYDRKNGDNLPIFGNEQKLAEIRGAGNWIAETHPAAINILETLTSYVVSTGFTFTADPLDTDGSASRMVQAVIDEFLERERWCGSLDGELFKRTRKSGERFLKLQHIGGGYACGDIHEPSWITQPENFRDIEDYYDLPSLEWKYGIASEWGHPERVWGYFSVRHGDPNDAEYIPVERMSHVKVNVERNVKRGLSDFYAGEEWLGGVRKLLSRTLQGGSIQASIALIRRWGAGTTRSQMAGANESEVDFDLPGPLLPGSGTRTETRAEYWYPGKIIDVKGADYETGPLGQSNAPTYIEIVQAGLRMAGLRWSMPEFMVSADASNANYSSTLVAKTPFGEFIKRTKTEAVQEDVDVLWKVVDIACQHGRLPFDSDQARRLVKITGTPPKVESDDPLRDHTIRQQEHEAGILSLRTWAEEAGRDYDQEQQSLAAEPVTEVVQQVGQAADALGMRPDRAVQITERPALESEHRRESLAVRAIDRLLSENDGNPR